ncbi:unnamed protein product, partial [Rotaria sp. Silwood2]
MAAKAIFGATSEPRRKLALVIGIGNYEHVLKLKNPQNDAKDLSSVLHRIGFITDEALLDKTRVQIKHKLVDFEHSIQFNDVVLFYFAGHGVQWEDQTYLIPRDFPNFPEIIETDSEKIADILQTDASKKERSDLLKKSAINAQDILNTLSDQKPYVIIFLLDCCREYALQNSDLGTRALSVGNSQSAGLTAVHKAGALIAFACAPGKLVNDRAEEKNSLFMKHLLKHIATPNEDIVNILRDVTNGVMKDSNDEQIPFLSVQLRHKNIYLCEQSG